MKLLFLTNAMETGGVETNLVLLAKEVVARGHDVMVVSSGGRLAPRCTDVGASHLTIPIGPGAPWKVAASVAQLRAAVHRAGVDLIHVFSASGAAIARIASLLPGRAWPPVVSSIMGLANSPEEPAYVTNLRNFACTLGASRVLIISPEIGRMVRRLPLNRHRLVERKVVGVDLDFGSRAKEQVQDALMRELGLSSGAPLITTIGNLAPRKSHELFVRAAPVVLREFPRAVFAIAGEGPQRKELEAEIARDHLGDSVKLLGDRSEIPSLLGLTTVCVKPGIVEGFIGITVLEAQSMGCPVVAFETEDVKLAIDDGVTGVLAAKGDSQSLGEAILRLLRDPNQAAAIAAAGRRKVQAEYSIQAVVSGLLGEYASVLRAHGHAVPAS